MIIRLFSPRALITALVFLLFFPLEIKAINAQETPLQENKATAEKADETGRLGGQLLSVTSQHIQMITEQMAEAGQGLLAVPEFFKELVLEAQEPRTLSSWGEMALKIFLVLLGGLLAEGLVRRLLGRLRRSLEDREADKFLFRALFLIARTILDVIPMAIFALAAYGILSIIDLRYETRLIALTLVNASVLARIIMAVSRLVLVPGLPALRLFPLGEETVHYLYIWIRRVTFLSVYGYFILEAALLMGAPGSLHAFLLRFLGLSVAVMLVILVRQNKKDVADWLRRDRPGPAHKREREKQSLDTATQARPGLHAIGSLRRRLADFWHVAAITIIIGLFLIWALDIEGGLIFLLSGLALTLLTIVLTGLLVRLIDQGVDRLFKISEELKAAYPELEDRANRYQPFVRRILKGFIYIIALFSILEVWGLGTLGWIFSPRGGVIIGEILTLVLIIAGAFLLWEIVSAMIERSLLREAEEGKGSTRKITLLPLLRNVVRITLVVMASMLVLSQIGLNIGPLLAGAGIIGLAIGFGAQTLVRDVITGAFILVENGISVGDWVEAGGHSGTVERLTVRTVTLRGLDGTVHIVPFGDVTTVTNYNRDYGYALIDAGVAYRESYDEVVRALQDVTAELRQDDTWGPYITGDLEVFGLNKLGDSAVEIRVRVKTQPMRQFGVRRAFLERMKRVFDERGIEIPFPHRTIWFGTDKDGTAPPMHLAQNNQKSLESSSQKPATEPGLQMASTPETSEDVGQVGERAQPQESENKT